MKNRGFLSLSVALLFLGLALAYQNCGQAGFDQAELSSEESQGPGDSSLRQVPFPFVLRPNHLAYSSCPMTNNAVLPSLQIAAFDDQNVAQYPMPSPGLSRGGLGLRTEFIDYMRGLGTQDPAVRDRRFAEHISRHPDVVGTRAVISFRSRSDYRDTRADLMDRLGKRSTSLSEIMPFVFPALDQTAIASEYVIRRQQLEDAPGNGSEISYRNFFPGVSRRNQQGMMASIFLGSSTNFSQNDISELINNMILTFGFAREDEANKLPDEIGYIPLGASGRGDRMQGLGLQMQLNSPSVDMRSAGRAISINSELDLMTGASTGARWDCSRAVRIMKASDASQCPAPREPPGLLGESYNEYESLYRLLSPDQWRINLHPDFRCAVPLNTAVSEQCYGNSNVEYRVNFPCDPNAAGGMAMCPHWLTLCLRLQ